MMPAQWRWYACVEGEGDECGFESGTREGAVEAILRDMGPNVTIEVMEARMSTAKRWEGADFVPFVAVRNREVIDLSMRELTHDH